RAVHGAAVGDLGGGGGLGGRGCGGLRRGAGGAGVDRAGRGDARLLALLRGGGDFRRDHVVDVGGERDQADRDDGQEGDHQREALEEVGVVVAHWPFSVAGRPGRGDNPAIIPERPGGRERRPYAVTSRFAPSSRPRRIGSLTEAGKPPGNAVSISAITPGVRSAISPTSASAVRPASSSTP